jgi:ABC-type multidrug transport system ATPase subunit
VVDIIGRKKQEMKFILSLLVTKVNSMENLIYMDHVTKKYGSKIILQNICLQVKAGDSIALTGHNGSGKSTLLKIMSGLVLCDSGKIEYQKKLRFNYVPEHFPKLAITPRQYIMRVGVIDGIEKGRLKEQSLNLFKMFYMDTMIDTPIKHLSKGTIQKVAVIQAMLTTPDVLLLDEPLAGQDMDSQKVFIDLARNMNESGVTIVMSSHEEWLISALSKQVYEIRNMNLVQRSINSFTDYAE